MKFRVYLETSFISYLVARKSRDLKQITNHDATKYWWNHERHNFECYVSQLAIHEAGKGNPGEARKRLEVCSRLRKLAITSEAEEIARQLLTQGAFPQNAVEDALHVGIAAAHKMDFILTWNFRHLANVVAQNRMQSVLRTMNIKLPVMCIPQELTGG